jgi:hypothetical protein
MAFDPHFDRAWRPVFFCRGVAALAEGKAPPRAGKRSLAFSVLGYAAMLRGDQFVDAGRDDHDPIAEGYALQLAALDQLVHSPNVDVAENFSRLSPAKKPGLHMLQIFGCLVHLSPDAPKVV